MEHVQQVCQVSQRRVCQVLGVPRTSARYRPKVREDADLIAALSQLRVEFPTWGYRKLTGVLRQQGWQVNPKRIFALWRAHGWQRRPSACRKVKATGSLANACHVRRAEVANHAWAVDFVSDRTWRGQKLKILTVVDEYTREALAIEIRPSMGQAEVSEILGKLIQERGAPEFVRSDNGSEFAAKMAEQALKEHGVEVALIAPGSPWQNGKNERFNGILSQEVLSREVWGNLLEAQLVVSRWRTLYNEVRPHGSLGMMTPNAYAQKAREEGMWRSKETHD